MPTRNTTTRDKHRRALIKAKAPCHICGKLIDYTLPSNDPMSFQADHLTALSRGGTDTLSNIGAAHRACNRAKSDKPHAPIIRVSGTLKKTKE